VYEDVEVDIKGLLDDEYGDADPYAGVVDVV
jgi:hypothetical protein